MSDTDDKTSVVLDSGSESPLLDEKASSQSSDVKTDKPKETKPEFREVKVGIWTVYYAITEPWTRQLPALGSLRWLLDVAKGLPIVWDFFLETLSLGPVLFAIYFMTATLTSVVSSMKLYNNLKILELVSPNIHSGQHTIKITHPDRETYGRSRRQPTKV
jgi:hypothetical protein